MNEELWKLLQKAKKDAALRRKIWETQQKADPTLALCELATELDCPVTARFSQKGKAIFPTCTGAWRAVRLTRVRHGAMSTDCFLPHWRAWSRKCRNNRDGRRKKPRGCFFYTKNAAGLDLYRRIWYDFLNTQQNTTKITIKTTTNDNRQALHRQSAGSVFSRDRRQDAPPRG